MNFFFNDQNQSLFHRNRYKIAVFLVAFLIIFAAHRYDKDHKQGEIETAEKPVHISGAKHDDTRPVIKRIAEEVPDSFVHTQIKEMLDGYPQLEIVHVDSKSKPSSDELIFCGANVTAAIRSSSNLQSAPEIITFTVGDSKKINGLNPSMAEGLHLGESAKLYYKRRPQDKFHFYFIQLLGVSSPTIRLNYYELDILDHGSYMRPIKCGDFVRLNYRITNAAGQEFIAERESQRFGLGYGVAPIQLEKAIANVGDGGSFVLRINSSDLVRFSFHKNVVINENHLWFEALNLPANTDLSIYVNVTLTADN